MMRRNGFTVVELIITIVIMGILLTLAVVSLRSSQADARDNERLADVENLARALENFYSSPRSGATLSGSGYPGNSTLTLANTPSILPDLDERSLYAPNTKTFSIVPATNALTTVAGILPKPTASTYVYQSLTADGTLCSNHATTECRRFNLYYQLESDKSIVRVASKPQ